MLWSALLLGFAGSFHCVGMCGPIALSVSSNEPHFGKFVLGKTLYNFGRILTYGLLGLVIGLLGWGIKLAGYQQLLSIAFGIVILLFVVSSITSSFTLGILKPFKWLNRLMKSMFAGILSSKNRAKWFLLGLANGVLPCGFVYIALSAAGLQAHPVNGMLFMMMFGLGTFPAMFIVSFAGNLFSFSFRSILSKAAPYLVSVIAVLLILRGLNLGVPYISPKIISHTTQPYPANCCSRK